ncbi:MAG: hypothetical protein IPJ40_03860 [Saprospirales bacterium]|nr:hypothetical protein [Saprospirales bacterium]
MHKEKHYTALFDYDSFLIRLLPKEFEVDEPEERDQTMSFQLLLTALFSKQKRDSFSLEQFENLPNEAEHLLGHETFHWWQAISSPFYIIRFLLAFKLIRVNGVKHNINVNSLPDPFMFPNDENQLMEHYKSVEANFMKFSMDRTQLKDLRLALTSFKREHNIKDRSELIHRFRDIHFKNIDIYRVLYNQGDKIFLNEISVDPPTAMPFFQFPHLNEGQQLPGYSAILDYFYYINFSGEHIIESATYISELLLAKKGNTRS